MMQQITPRWINKIIRPLLTTGETPAVQAECLGTLAIHAPVGKDAKNYPNHLLITHEPTSLVVCRLTKREECRKLVEYLWTHYSTVFKLRYAEQLRAALPTDFSKWMLSCVVSDTFKPMDEKKP